MFDLGSRNWARGIGFLVGLGIAVATVVAWRIPGGGTTPGTDVLIAALPTGEVAVAHPGPFVSGTGLRPGSEADGASGSVDVRNQAGSRLAFRVVATSSDLTLGPLLWIRIDVRDQTLFRGPLSGLWAGSDGTFTLGSGRSTSLDVTAWIPEGAADRSAGRLASVDLSVEPVVEGW